MDAGHVLSATWGPAFLAVIVQVMVSRRARGRAAR